jgi:eukaryotic-like serine/threonine-protein kinase
MSASRRERLQQLFLEARALTAERRARFLDEHCAGDDPLRQELDTLLAVDAQPGVLDAPLPGAQSVASLSALRLPAAGMPERMGAFRIVRELGRGGMGVVYLGERDDGQFEQRVAIKIVAAEAADDEQRRSFLAERRILAALSHPNIARLIDGGIAADGRPYLVLEYVDGVPVTRCCDEQRLDTVARLRIFLDICAAVQHAHAQLIIHRDLKPGNILVDAARRVHLLDFGIARLLLPPEEAAPTRPDLRALTPEYASPEQVRGETLTIASDVYSLGTLLYELLCGAGPYALTTRGAMEVAQAVCTQEPLRPSVRALRAHDGDDDALPTTRERAAARGTTPERLSRLLAGDLDSIVLMALRKEPERRYASVASLREDIERHLAGLPVRAHRGSRRYRAGRFVRRHRAAVIATGLGTAALIAGAAVSGWQALAARRERDRAELALAEAETLTQFLAELFQTGELDDGRPGADVTAADLLRRGIARADELADRPLLQARLLAVIGGMSHNLGRFHDAVSLLERAATLQRSAGDPAALELSGTLLLLARAETSRGRHDDARVHAEEALVLRQARLPSTDAGIAEALQQLGNLYGGLRQEQLFLQALAMLEASGTGVEQQVALLHGLATNQRRRGLLDRVVATDRVALQRARLAFGDDDFRTGQAMVHLADQIAHIDGDFAAAESLYTRGIALIEKRFGHSSTRLLHGLHSLASLYAETDRHAEGERLLRRSVAIREAATGAGHPALAHELRLLALHLARRRDRLPEAETLIREALEHLRATDSGWRDRARTLHALAEIRHRQGRHAHADTIFAEVIELYGTGVLLGEALRDYGRLLVQARRWYDAEPLLQRALVELDRHYQQSDHPNVLEAQRALAELYHASGRPDLARNHDAPPGRYVAY